MKTNRLKSMLYLVIASSSILCLATASSAQIVNGNFSTGDLTGWSHTGFFDQVNISPDTGDPNYATFSNEESISTITADTDGVEMTQTTNFDGIVPTKGTTPVFPESGSFMAFVSNEVSGPTDLTGSIISQTFTVTPGSSTVTFQAKVLNNDFPVGFPIFDDFAGVSLTQGNTTLDQFNVDLAGNGSNAHVTPFTDEGGFLDSTPWLNESFDVSGLVGQSVTINAYSLQFGNDDDVETRLLFNNVQLNPNDAISTPEPSAIIALLLGVVLIGVKIVMARNRENGLARQN